MRGFRFQGALRAAPGSESIRDDRIPCIRQRFYEVRDDECLGAVALLLNHFRPESTLAFCNTKQHDRDQVLVQFANRSCSVLVATDVAATGRAARWQVQGPLPYTGKVVVAFGPQSSNWDFVRNRTVSPVLS